MESSFLSTAPKVFSVKGRSRWLERQELAPPPHRWCVDRTCEPGGVGFCARCVKCDGGQGVDKRGRRYGAIEDDGEWKEMVKWAADKCRGELGMVEMLECLEKEAIMGEDSGKDPTDYDRRARIFDKSSKVFQALRDEQQQQQHRPPA